MYCKMESEMVSYSDNTAAADGSNTSIKNHVFLYYKKPSIGSVSFTSKTNQPPVEIIFTPNKSVALGMPFKALSSTTAGSSHPINITPFANEVTNTSANAAVVCSGPEFTPSDILQKKSLILSFVSLAIVNIFITCYLYSSAGTADASKVYYPAAASSFINAPNTFQIVPKDRRGIESVNFAFTLIVLFIGIASTIIETSLGVSIYCIAITINFMLNAVSLPYFLYSLRLILDMIMLYFALVIRTRLVYSFLPVHVHLG